MMRLPNARPLAAVAMATTLLLGIGPRAEVLAAQEFQAPELFVSVVVDQLRQDVLEHYAPAFSGGLRRLLDEGYRFTQASHAHARTSTAPGHATITTGVFPSRHGVVANSWHQRRGFRWEVMYAVEDLDSPILGYEETGLEGRSPETLLRDGLPDWFLATDPDSRRVSISKKDRAAIPMGGKNTEHVYWILPELGRFITSTHYMDDYPGWLEDFNEEVMPGIVSPHIWESEVPVEHQHLAREDAAPYEGDGIHTIFPHVSAEENRPPEGEAWDATQTAMVHNMWGLDQPRADRAVIELAKVAIDELDLGQRGHPDYLAISLSATDRVGHGYGPFSQEVLSTLIHVDRVLGELFESLDEQVGVGKWTLGLTGDHGVATMPEYARSQGDRNADRVLRSEALPKLETLLRASIQAGGSPRDVADRLARSVEDLEFVEAAYTHHGLTLQGAPADTFAVLYRNSYYPGRAWDHLSRFGVDLRFGEGDYFGSPTGTNHETPYWYDRHVPMIFIGAGVDGGVSDRPVYTVDFAPTMAAFAGLAVPDDLDGVAVY